jgi:hypothetical protein
MLTQLNISAILLIMLLVGNFIKLDLVYGSLFDDMFNRNIFDGMFSGTKTEFGDPVNLHNKTASPVIPAIAASGNNVYVVWSDGFPGNSSIFIRSSDDNGTTFGETISISKTIGFLSVPTLAASDNNVYVGWKNFEFRNSSSRLLLKASNDNGTTFGEVHELDNKTGFLSVPTLAASGSNAYLTWTDFLPGNSGVFFKFSTDGGKSFDAESNMAKDTAFPLTSRIAVISDHVYILWSELFASEGKENSFGIVVKAGTVMSTR